MKLSSRTKVILATLAFSLSQAYLIGSLHSLRPSIVELQLTFAPDRYWEILRLWGEAGRAAYHDHFSADFIHIGLFSLFGYLLAHHAGLFDPDERKKVWRLAVMLPVAGVFDRGEHRLQLMLVDGATCADSAAIALSAACSTAKWGLVVAFSWISAQRLLRRLGFSSR